MKHVKLFEQFIAGSYRGSRRVNEAEVTSDDIKTYLFSDEDIDDLGWSDEKIDKISKGIVDAMLKTKILSKSDYKRYQYKGQPDYMAAASEEVPFLDDDDKNSILSAWNKSIKESRRVNESTGADLLALLDDALSGGVEFQTIYDMKKEDQPPSRELKAAAKKIGGGDDNVAVIYSQQTEDWDTVLKTARDWSRAGGKYVEIEDEDGSAIVFGI
jgi:hypothetical protein